MEETRLRTVAEQRLLDLAGRVFPPRSFHACDTRVGHMVSVVAGEVVVKQILAEDFFAADEG